MNKALVFVAIFICMFQISAATDHSGAITTNETWLAANNPHIITGTVTINSGVTLTIGAGCEVKFNHATYLQTYGTLFAAGSSGNGITFTQNETAQWAGVRIASGGTGNLNYSTIEYSTYSTGYGIYATSAASLTVDNCLFQNNDVGFYGNNTNPSLTNNTFINNPTAIYFHSTTAPHVGVNNSISGHNIAINFTSCSAPTIASGTTISNSTEVGVYYYQCSALGTIDNLTMSNNDAYGAFRFNSCGEFTLGNSIVYSNNNWPFSMDVGSYPSASSTIPTSGNINNGIRVLGGSSASTSFWYLFPNLDYIITGTPQVSAGGSLTIAPGNVIKFNHAIYLQTYGTLFAAGTSGNGITFTQNGTAQWAGVRFASGATGNLTYCTIEQATYSTGYGIYSVSPASLTVNNCLFQNNDIGFYGNNTNPTLTNNTFINNPTAIYFQSTTAPHVGANNSITGQNIAIYFHSCSAPTIAAGTTISNSTEVGVYYYQCSALGTIDNMTVSDNEAYGAFRFNNSGEFTLGNSIVYSNNNWPFSMDVGSYPSASSTIPTFGNINNNIRVIAGSSASTSFWYLFPNLDYILTGTPQISAGGSLTIAPGNVIKFNHAIYLQTYGTLFAAGSSGNGITFTQNETAQWAGVRFASGATGNLTYCTIEHATYSTGYGIYSVAPASLTVNNCLFQENDIGFYGSNTNPTLTNNTFINNPTAIYFQSTTAPHVGANNSITGQNIAIYFHSCSAPTIAAGTTISNSTEVGVYYYQCSALGTIDNLTVSDNAVYGAFRFNNSGEFTLGNSIVYSNNNWPFSMDVGSYPSAGSTIPTSGNINNNIRVLAGSSANTSIWYLFPNLDYILTGTPQISAAGSLTIAPGNVIKFNQAIYLQTYGTLFAAGNSANGITFTQNETAQWAGVRFANGATGNLNYCTIEHATYSTGYGIYAVSPASLNISHCLLHNNDRGFYGSNCTANFINNSIINNDYGIYLAGNSNAIFGSNLSEWNDIYSNSTYDLYNGNLDIDADYIYWGTVYYDDIMENIFDERDNPALGLVNIVPWTNNAHSIAIYIPPPVIVDFTVVADVALVEWEAVALATTYKVYSSLEPHPDAASWTLEAEGVTSTNWSEPASIEKKFYHVIAVE